MPARVLLASPIPTHPQDQGNSARIYSFGRMLQSAGIIVHFLYYQMEGLTPAQRADMEQCWDHFHPVPCPARAMEPSGDGHYRLDDWWDPTVASVALQLHRRWHFSAVIADYVWFSGILAAFGNDVLKVLDTHDVFGGRADRFRDAGLEPEWFYTTPEEEARGLARADIALAIQDDEAAYFRALGHKDVRVIGHIVPLRKRLPRPPGGGEITAGYLASGNPINVNSFDALRRCLGEHGARRMKFVVAGSICGKLTERPEPFEAVGRLDHVDEFYDSVDLVLNPMTFGTGLKIKSVEALFQGLPLVATDVAMVGLPVRHPFHRFASVEALVDGLQRIGEGELAELARASRDCGAEYAASVRAAYRDLVAAIRQ
jgi:glycosyltransferase involved in cell wall biosynthesis